MFNLDLEDQNYPIGILRVVRQEKLTFSNFNAIYLHTVLTDREEFRRSEHLFSFIYCSVASWLFLGKIQKY